MNPNVDCAPVIGELATNVEIAPRKWEYCASLISQIYRYASAETPQEKLGTNCIKFKL